MTYCPQCPHEAKDHGTYGCLFGWRWEDQRLVKGCECVGRRLVDHARQVSEATVFGLPFPPGTGG